MGLKLDVLVFGAHPDDSELGAGGTIALEVSRGKKVGIVDLTRGELGTRGSAEIREKEADEAAKILGLSMRENLDLGDGFIFNTKENQVKVIEVVRKYRPDLVLCNAIDDRHIDHARASTLVRDACFLSGLAKIESKYPGEEEWQDAWRPSALYHYIQWKNLAPDIVVDISNHIDKKMEAIAAYASQFYDPDSVEPATPISSENFKDSIRYRARDLGRLAGVQYAEGFTVERTPLVKTLFEIY